MNTRKTISMLLAAAALGASFAASAEPMIRLSDGSTTLDIGNASRASALNSPLNGSYDASYVGTVGTNWMVSLANAPGSFRYTLNAANVGLGGTFLDVALSDTGFSLADAASTAQFIGSINGLTGGLVTWWMFVDDGNQLFTQTSQIGQGTNASSSFAAMFDDLRSVDGTFSMTLLVRINHGNAERLTNLAFQGVAQLVPEPGTALLIACGLLGMGLTRKRA